MDWLGGRLQSAMLTSVDYARAFPIANETPLVSGMLYIHVYRLKEENGRRKT